MRLGLTIEPTVTLQDAAGMWHTVPAGDAAHCEACDRLVLVDELDRLSGEQINACPACLQHARNCADCGRGYLTADGLADGSVEEEALIRQDSYGRWICDECRSARKAAAKWEGVNARIDRAIERNHGLD